MKYRLPALVAILVAVSPPVASAQTTAQSVIEHWIDAYDARTADIDDFTVTSDAFTSYNKKYTVDGRTMFKTSTRLTTGGAGLGNMTTTFALDNPHLMSERVGDVAEYAGTADIDGRECHVLRVTDFSGFQETGTMSGTPPKKAEIFIDATLWVVHRFKMEVEADVDGEVRAIQPTIDFEDYRDSDGLLYPYTTRVTMAGVDVKFTPEQVQRAKDAMLELEERMKGMPEAQRDAMRKMVEPQMKRMQDMVESGRVESVFKVSEVTVNSGLSNDLFEK